MVRGRFGIYRPFWLRPFWFRGRSELIPFSLASRRQWNGQLAGSVSNVGQTFPKLEMNFGNVNYAFMQFKYILDSCKWRSA